MSRLDEALSHAAGSEEPYVDTLPPVTTSPAAKPRAKRSLGLLAAVVVMGGGILTLVFTSFEDSAIYSKGVDELLAERDKLTHRSVRVEGTLVKGSLVKRESPCEYRFQVQKKGATLPVSFAQCVVPDTFRDVPGMDVEVTAEGKLGEDGHFTASHIMAKCPSKYEMNDRQARGEQSPHGTLTGEASAVTAPGGH